jgi:hypothetical protein
MPAPSIASRKVGQQSLFTATFRNDDGDLVDPSTVTFRWRVESSTPTQTDYQYGSSSLVARSSIGVYHFQSPPYAVAVTHHVRVVSTGVNAADEASISVAASVFTVVP